MGLGVVHTGSRSQSRKASWTWGQAWISFQVCWELWIALTQLTLVNSLSHGQKDRPLSCRTSREDLS